MVRFRHKLAVKNSICHVSCKVKDGKILIIWFITILYPPVPWESVVWIRLAFFIILQSEVDPGYVDTSMHFVFDAHPMIILVILRLLQLLQLIILSHVTGANILCDASSNIKLADFGISKRLQTVSATSGAQTFCGTYNWMAPEIFNTGGQYGTGVDIW